MKKNTKIIVWSVVGLAVATGAFFGIKSLMKKKADKKFQAELLEEELKKKAEAELEQKKMDTPPLQELTPTQASAIAYSIFKLNKQGVSPAILNKTKELTARLEKSGYSYQNGKAVKNVG